MAVRRSRRGSKRPRKKSDRHPRTRRRRRSTDDAALIVATLCAVSAVCDERSRG